MTPDQAKDFFAPAVYDGNINVLFEQAIRAGRVLLAEANQAERLRVVLQEIADLPYHCNSRWCCGCIDTAISLAQGALDSTEAGAAAEEPGPEPAGPGPPSRLV